MGTYSNAFVGPTLLLSSDNTNCSIEALYFLMYLGNEDDIGYNNEIDDLSNLSLYKDLESFLLKSYPSKRVNNAFQGPFEPLNGHFEYHNQPFRLNNTHYVLYDSEFAYEVYEGNLENYGRLVNLDKMREYDDSFKKKHKPILDIFDKYDIKYTFEYVIGLDIG